MDTKRMMVRRPLQLKTKRKEKKFEKRLKRTRILKEKQGHALFVVKMVT